MAKLKQMLNGNEGTWMWRILVIALFSIVSWNLTRFVNKVDALEANTVKTYQLCEFKADLKDIQQTMNKEIVPQVARLAGQFDQFMEGYNNEGKERTGP